MSIFRLTPYSVTVLQRVNLLYRQNIHSFLNLASSPLSEEFQIKTLPDVSNVVFLSAALQLHTDLSYYEYTNGVTMLHCVKQTDGEGGDSLLTDCLYNVEKLRKENKEAFDILSKVEVNWFDKGTHNGYKFNSIFRCPVIKLDSKGNLDQVHLSIPQRDSYFTSEVKDVKVWYKAFKQFLDNLNAETSKIKLNSGELMVFDNTRILHGRTAYKDAKQQRHLVGCCLDWDEIYSKIRVLKAEM